MQKTTNRIARRITFSFLLYGTVITLMLGVSMVAAFKTIESSMLDDILFNELKHFREKVEGNQIPEFFHFRPTSIYVAQLDEIQNLPSHVRNLTEGMHDVAYNDRNYRVLVKHFGNSCYIAKLDATIIHERERDFIHLVWLCSIVILLIALVIGWGAAYQFSRPIKLLANQIVAIRNKPSESMNLSEFNDDEIGVLAQGLQHYHEQLQQLLIREEEFASNVSHELRTQVTSISLAAEVLAMKTDLSSIEHKRIKRIQRAVGEMSELIETFLVLSQIKNESINHHNNCEMESIVRRVVEQQSIWLGDKPIVVKIEENGLLLVSAPRGILSVLVANIIKNAFRYTQRGTVTVSITSRQLTVVDTGIGMDAHIGARIFERNVKNTNDANSVGLGLAIVKRICEHYGWTVSFESIKGQGSQFTVLFAS